MCKINSLLLGIDIGTTSVKTVLLNEKGEKVETYLQEYTLLTPKPNIVELDPEIYWNSCVLCIRKMLNKLPSNVSSKIKALAISSQGETLITLSKQGKPLRNAIVWLDNRSIEECNLLKDVFSSDTVYKKTGCPEIEPTWASTKILWMKRNEPQIFNKAYKFCLVEDYLIYKFTGEFFCDAALYTSTLLIDINMHNWWDEMLDFIGIKKNRLPKLMNSCKIVGHLTDEAAKITGLSKDTVVVTAGMDQACAAIGSGNIKEGRITESTGSGINIIATTNKFYYDNPSRIVYQCHIMDDKYIALPWCKTAGMVLKWFKDNFCQLEIKTSKEKKKDPYDFLSMMAEKVCPGSDGLIMLPHLAGAMSPEMDSFAKGVFYGIGLNTTKGHFIRSIMEATAYMLRANLDDIEKMGIKTSEIISLGGASKSKLWNQIKSDVTGKRINILDNPEAGCLGAAIIAGYAVGIYTSLEEGCEKAARCTNEFLPNIDNINMYNICFEIYEDLYQSLKSMYRKSININNN